MRILPPLEGFEYTKGTYAELVTRFTTIPKWTHQVLGESFDGHDIHGFSLGSTAAKPVIYVQGQLHGLHEWRSAYWVSQFMKLLAGEVTSPAHENLLDDLRARYSFYFVPCANPDGYVNYTYGNGNGVNLNRNFGPIERWEAGNPDPGHAQYRGPSMFSEPETQIIRDLVLDLKPASFLCNHSWGGAHGLCTLQAHPREYARATENMLMSAKVSLGRGSDTVVLARYFEGLSHNWAGNQMSKHGRKIIAVINEAGDQLPEAEQAELGMTGILHYMLMVDRLLTTGDLISS